MIPIYVYLDFTNEMVKWNVTSGVLYGPKKLKNEVPGYVSFFMVSRARTKRFWELEQRIEKVRLEKFPNKVSRLNCLYFFQEKPKNYISNIPPFDRCNLTTAFIASDASITKADMRWLDAAAANLLEGDAWIESYWRGEPCNISSRHMPDEPIWECLTDSDILIMDKETRQMCYDKSLNIHDDKVKALLMLNAWAFHCGKTFGNVTYSIVHKEGKLYFYPIMNGDPNEAAQIAIQIKHEDIDYFNAIGMQLYKYPNIAFATPDFSKFAVEISE